MGLGPVFFPTQRGFRQRPVHCQPVPLDAAQFIKRLDPFLPEFEKDARLHPGLKTIMRRRMGAYFGLVEGAPLAARAQDVEDGIRTAPVRHPRASSAKAMRIEVYRQHRLEDRPHFIRNAKAGRRAVIRRSRSAALVRCFFVHASSCSRLFGQAVSQLKASPRKQIQRSRFFGELRRVAIIRVKDPTADAQGAVASATHISAAMGR